MALTDIVFPVGDKQNISVKIDSVMSGNINGILTKKDPLQFTLILQGGTGGGVTSFAY